MSTKTKFTPGPWVIETYHGSLFKICKPDFKPGDEVTHRLTADANLIAASPEMFAALEMLINDMNEDTDPTHISRVVVKIQSLMAAKAAIAKARGENK